MEYIRALFNWHALTLILASVSNNIHYKMQKEII